MAEVVLPELDEVDVDLVPRRTLGDAGGDRVAGQVSIGRAQAIRLYPDADGAGDEDHYYLVSLSCTFRQGDAPVVSAVFSIELVQAEIIGVTSPVVWSMDPLRRATAVKHRRVVSVGPNLKIVPDVVEFDTSIEHSAEYTVDVNHLVAEGEGERQVDWTFTATKAVDLVGVHQLSLVARTSSRSAVHAVSTGANLGHRGAVKGSERHGMATNGSQRHRLTWQ
ncbi:hypothetical protein [Amycolatopsis sp.]|uniref:hypothetical protein n=1 Tax=Amycolatopsis sp. TaxID=37632 RepID=UPI002E0CF353|nr:hypothetical protein [Amycolatopsis sp.]